MSTQNRKISYWGLDFQTKEGNSFDGTIFCDFMDYLKELEVKDLIYRDEKNNKAFAIDNIQDDIKQGMHLYMMVLKSCKYNHSPNYMSSIDGVERDTDKKLYEGDKELTHVCFRIDEIEAYTIIEERRSGVSIGMLVRYLNKYFKDFIEKNDEISNDLCIMASIIPSENFLTSLKKTERISCAEIFVEKEVMGSGYLDLMELNADAREDIVISVKSKPRQSLAHKTIENAFVTFISGGSKITRIRIRGKDINKMNIIIDSLNGKKADAVTVELTKKGVVDSQSFFARIEEMLGIAI